MELYIPTRRYTRGNTGHPSVPDGAALPGGVLLFVDTDNAVNVSCQLPEELGDIQVYSLLVFKNMPVKSAR